MQDQWSKGESVYLIVRLQFTWTSGKWNVFKQGLFRWLDCVPILGPVPVKSKKWKVSFWNRICSGCSWRPNENFESEIEVIFWWLNCILSLGPVKRRKWKCKVFFWGRICTSGGWKLTSVFQVGSVQVVGATNCCSYFCTMMAPILSPLVEPRSFLWQSTLSILSLLFFEHQSPLIPFEFGLEFILKLFVPEFIFWLQYVSWSWPWLWLLIAVCLFCPRVHLLIAVCLLI